MVTPAKFTREMSPENVYSIVLEEAKTVSGLGDDDTYFLPVVICFEVTQTAHFQLERISNECHKTNSEAREV